MKIDVPDDVRRRHQILAGPLVLVTVWAMGRDGELRGLWVSHDEDDSGRIYPITGVAIEDLHDWLEGA